MLSINHDYKTINYSNIDIDHEYVVLHCMCYDDTTALEFLCNPKSRVSAHFYIGVDGEIYNLVDEEKQAWHAGFSTWKNDYLLNKNSIGIELGNQGQLGNESDYTKQQYESLKTLLKYLMDKYNISKENILAHSDIAPDRKTDPGAKFDWDILIKDNLATDFIPTSQDALESLESFGYSLKYNNVDVIKAFQRRFLPNNITGELDDVTNEYIKK